MRIIALIASLGIALNVYAFQGENFKIISEKTTQSPGMNGHTVSINKTSSKKNFLVETATIGYDANGKIKEYIKVQGQHRVYMFNTTDTPKRYTYTYFLGTGNDFYSHEKMIELGKNGSFRDDAYTYGTVQRDKAGNFPIKTNTSITGAESSSYPADSFLKVTN